MTVEDFRSTLEDQLMAEGIIYHWVDGQPDSVMHRDVPWAYTIGRTMHGRPELLVTGLDERESKDLLWFFHDKDVTPDAPAESERGPCAFFQAEKGLLYGAYVAFGPRFEALQVCWQGPGDQPLHPRGGLIMTDPYDDEEL